MSTATKPVLKKKRLYIRGVGTVTRSEFNEKHLEKLKQLGAKIEDHVEFKPVVERRGTAQIPTSRSTKDSILAFLEARGHEIPDGAKKEDLLDLCVPNENWSKEEIVMWADRNQVELTSEDVPGMLTEINEQ